jgi:hypothetical protein
MGMLMICYDAHLRTSAESAVSDPRRPLVTAFITRSHNRLISFTGSSFPLILISTHRKKAKYKGSAIHWPTSYTFLHRSCYPAPHPSDQFQCHPTTISVAEAPPAESKGGQMALVGAAAGKAHIGTDLS